ncbi:unnamed protein product [Phytomonas sp. EM1]|nr:unnamed protein product [Phytomonas sp. EM1]|eukprot:CCW65818.1 unnamed protein product [Phytomonas sp. isolate EM1]
MPSMTTAALWLQALRQYSALYSKPSASVPSNLPGNRLMQSNSTTRINSRVGHPAGPLGIPSVRSFPSLSERLFLYETVAQAHLFGSRGFQLHPDSLNVLRQVRWELMKHSSRREKMIIMEKVLELFTKASQVYLYDPIPSAAAEQQSLMLEQVQCLVEARIFRISLSLHHLRHPLQCPQMARMDKDLPSLLLREAEAALRERRMLYHITSRTTNRGRDHKTGTSSSKVRNQTEDEKEDNKEDAELMKMQLYCAVGMAGARHPAEALRLCEMADNGDGRGFAFVVNRVAQLSRDGGQRAWELADGVPLSVLLKSAREALAGEMQLASPETSKPVEGDSMTINYEGNNGNNIPSFGGSVSLRKGRSTDRNIRQQKSGEAIKKLQPRWLQGLLEALLHRRRVTKGNDVTMKNWLLSFMRLFEEEVEKNKKGIAIPFYKTEENGIKIDSDKIEGYLTQSPLRHPEHIPRCIIETFLSVCPPTAWREAYCLVLHYNQAVSTPAREPLGSRHGIRRIPLGGLMAFLRLSGRPVEVLQLFYGADNLLIQPPHSPKEETRIKDPKGTTSTEEKSNLGIRLSEKAQACLALPQGIHLSEEDKRQPIIYNHVIMAFREVGLWSQAMQFYNELSPNLKNTFTEWSIAKTLLLVRSGHIFVDNLNEPSLDGKTYRVAVRCVHHALGIPEAAEYLPTHSTDVKNSVARDSTPQQRGISVPTADRDDVLESLALWAAVCGDWQEVCTLADHAPPTCRYIRLIAIASILRQLKFTELLNIKKDLSEALHLQYQSLCDCPKRSVKQICLGLAMLACTNSTVVIAQSNKMDSSDDHFHNVLDTMRLESVTVTALNELVHCSQSVMNEFITILMGYIRSIRTHQVEKFEKNADASLKVSFCRRSDDPSSSRSCKGFISLARENILDSTISLMYCLHSEEEGTSDMNYQNDLLVNVLKRLGEEHGLSIARVAPAMISSGCSPETILRLLT